MTTTHRLALAATLLSLLIFLALEASAEDALRAATSDVCRHRTLGLPPAHGSRQR